MKTRDEYKKDFSDLIDDDSKAIRFGLINAQDHSKEDLVYRWENRELGSIRGVINAAKVTLKSIDDPVSLKKITSIREALLQDDIYGNLERMKSRNFDKESVLAELNRIGAVKDKRIITELIATQSSVPSFFLTKDAGANPEPFNLKAEKLITDLGLNQEDLKEAHYKYIEDFNREQNAFLPGNRIEYAESKPVRIQFYKAAKELATKKSLLETKHNQVTEESLKKFVDKFMEKPSRHFLARITRAEKAAGFKLSTTAKKTLEHKYHKAVTVPYYVVQESATRLQHYGANHGVAELYMNKVIERYNKKLEEINTAPNPNANQNEVYDKKFENIIELVQNLEKIHPYPDFNCRMFGVLLLNSELINNGLKPVLMNNPNIFDFKEVSELKKAIQEGQKNFEALRKSKKNTIDKSHPTNQQWRDYISNQVDSLPTEQERNRAAQVLASFDAITNNRYVVRERERQVQSPVPTQVFWKRWLDKMQGNKGNVPPPRPQDNQKHQL